MLSYQRRFTRVVNIGGVSLGGNHPIRIQSMINADTLDTQRAVAQILRLAEAGSEYVRLTVPSTRDAENLFVIRKELEKRGCKIPLVADIHFNTKAAFIAAEAVHKVRINPGNFGTKKREKKLSLDEYDLELGGVEEAFRELIVKLKKNKTALRIGVNHGSLSDRIMLKYGNTVEGMVRSAIEFIEMAEKNDFHDLVISMKSSITTVMIEAYRKLVLEMDRRGMDYPLHLGVTEAGFGDEGRIKSAAGIGALLLEGLGDTIRVSLSEPPENEIPVARQIVRKIEGLGCGGNKDHGERNVYVYPEKKRFPGLKGDGFSYPLVGLVMDQEIDEKYLQEIGFQRDGSGWKKGARAADFIVVRGKIPSFVPPGLLFLNPDRMDPSLVMLRLQQENFYFKLKEALGAFPKDGKSPPLFAMMDYQGQNKAQSLVDIAIDLGGVFTDAVLTGVAIQDSGRTPGECLELAHEILQAVRLKTTKTEYISCPTCGRTQFDLITTAKKVRQATEHLAGLKIAVMGCIVNGPGEMADADYGYVGAGPDKIHLYKGQELVEKNLSSGMAVEKLIALIKKDGKWKEPGL